MIFVTLGSQKFQFDRLLRAIDQLIESGGLSEEVFAQTGYSTYTPKHFSFKPFLDRDAFSDMMSRCDTVITHGGTGAIVGAVKKGKKVIAVPRLAAYGEHVDDHQLQIIDQFRELNLICECKDCDKLANALATVRSTAYGQYQSSTQKYIDSLDAFIQDLM